MDDITQNKANMKYVEKQRGDVRDTWMDVSKAGKLLCWIPTKKINIDEGFRKIYKMVSEGENRVRAYKWQF